MTVLLNNVNANVTSNPDPTDGGKRVIVVRADNFGGGTVEIQGKSNNDPNARFLLIPGASFTSGDTKILDGAKSGMTYRAVLSGSSGASNVFVELV